MNSNEKGNVAELKIAAAAADLGIPVLRPMTEHGRYDLVFDVGGRLLKVQCKWGTLKAGVIRAQLAGCRVSPTQGYIRSTYDASEVDLIAIYVQEWTAATQSRLMPSRREPLCIFDSTRPKMVSA